jgi:hypothetical protein
LILEFTSVQLVLIELRHIFDELVLLQLRLLAQVWPQLQRNQIPPGVWKVRKGKGWFGDSFSKIRFPWDEMGKGKQKRKVGGSERITLKFTTFTLQKL